ncbi:hypothetical protein N7540_011175 [Penicillium herquei]|nr:hypothetical protein N7540_011055 [Penicillium herquei]KAJ6016584.1 hypothetical protein N7540_011175 [Penicillium herquei]
MSSQTGGVKKSRAPKTDAHDPHSKLRSVEAVAKSLTPGKLEAGMQQRSGDQETEGDPMDVAFDDTQPDESEMSDGDGAAPQRQKVYRSIETDGIELQDMGNSRTKASPDGARDSEGQGSQSNRGVSEVTSRFNRLAVIGPGDRSKTLDEFSDLVVDGWGYLRGSAYVILQQGPPNAVRFVFKSREGYTSTTLPCISNQDLRVSSVKTKGAFGKAPFRYSAENIAGIIGVVAADRKATNYSSEAPSMWVKIEWQGLDKKDMDKVVDNYSWIPRSDFDRFCRPRKAAIDKVKAVWAAQEHQYHKWVKTQPKKTNLERASTPCPLNASPSSVRSRRGTSRPKTPVRFSLPREEDSVTPSPSRRNRNRAVGTRSDPISLDELEDPNDVPSSPDSASTTSEAQSSDRRCSPSQGGSIQLNEEDFMQMMALKDGWHQKNPTELQEARDQAKHVFDAILTGRR